MVFKAPIEQMDKLEDLLPGIEDFLCTVLAKESLTHEAEEQRQYFVERLDIIKLPPSVPPRPQCTPAGLKLYPLTDGTLPTHNSSCDSIPEQEDFAAYQRELSRALVAKGSKSPPGSGEEEEVKVYDDIDSKDISANDGSQSQHEEESMYEIPQLKRSLNDSGYEKTVDPNTHPKIHESPTSKTENVATPVVPKPPPLPPRRERTSSNAANRHSVASLLEEKIEEINLKPEQQFSTSSHEEKKSDTKSEKSSDEPLEDYTGDEVETASLDSLDQDGGVKLPRVMKKKRHHHRVTHSLSAPLCDISNSFCDLEDVMLSGELYYKSTLLSTKYMVALHTISLVCYKFDKTDSKPVLVIPLRGYRATFHKRHSRQNYEIQLCHDELEDHCFLTYLKEWAQTWCNYINCVSDGRRVPGPHYNLVRNRGMEPAYGSTYDLTKSSSQVFGSSVSVCSYDGVDSGMAKVKKRNHSGNRQRLGSIVSRASQILDKFLAKPSPSGPPGVDPTNIPDKKNGSVSVSEGSKDKIDAELTSKSDSMKKLSIPERRAKSSTTSGASVSDQGSVGEPLTPLTPESGVFEPAVIEMSTEVPKVIKHQGYLYIYSSFNKRKWGKRWCKVLENNFECYRNQASTVCELEFLLRGCILRRAIEETKSQLGLMLLENNREKITVEPLSWNELGSWLRVLMKETSTPKPPEGLEGYMENVNEYHDIVEESGELDADSSIDKQNSQGCETSKLIMPNDFKNTKTCSSRNSYRDSGNCSGESMDGKSEVLERPGLHSEFSDSSLPRTAHKTGDLYTQVRKSSSGDTLAVQKEVGERTQTKPSNLMDEDKSHSTKVPLTGDAHIDAENEEDCISPLENEKSMVDEVLSRFTSQISSGYDDVDHEYEEFENITGLSNASAQSLKGRDHIYVDIDASKNENAFVENRRLSRDLTELDVISPIKEMTETKLSDISKHEKFLCSSFVDENQSCVLTSVDSKHTVLSKLDESNCDASEICTQKCNAASTVSNQNTHENTPKGNSEQFVDELTHVLSNLSLEDKGSEGGKIKGTVNSENLGSMCTLDSEDKVSNTKGKIDQASCDTNKPPLEPESQNWLEEDARTRRSVAIREMEEMGGDIDRTLGELRTKLVQLKNDRIVIHDRMLQSTLNASAKFLEDEYNRLNREVEKVNEEIACLEDLQREQLEREQQGEEQIQREKKKYFDDDAEEVDV